MSRRPWSTEDIDVVRRRYRQEPTAEIATELDRPVGQVYAKASTLGLRKTPEFFARFGHRLDGVIGKATRFVPGQPSWNKGTHFTAGGRSAETRFKPGQVSKRWDPDFYCVGALRITTGGDLQIKLAPGPRQWAQMSRYSWFLHTGKWPRRGMIVRSRNGDPYDCRAENLELLSTRENIRRNTIHTVLPPELRQVVQLAGALKRRITILEERRT